MLFNKLALSSGTTVSEPEVAVAPSSGKGGGAIRGGLGGCGGAFSFGSGGGGGSTPPLLIKALFFFLGSFSAGMFGGGGGMPIGIVGDLGGTGGLLEDSKIAGRGGGGHVGIPE